MKKEKNWVYELGFGTSSYLQECHYLHPLLCSRRSSPSRRRHHHASPRRTISSLLNHLTKPSSFSHLRFASSRAELPPPRRSARRRRHCRRSCSVEVPSPALRSRNRFPSYASHLPLNLPDPTAPPQRCRSATTMEQSSRRRPLPRRARLRPSRAQSKPPQGSSRPPLAPPPPSPRRRRAWSPGNGGAALPARALLCFLRPGAYLQAPKTFQGPRCKSSFSFSFVFKNSKLVNSI